MVTKAVKRVLQATATQLRGVERRRFIGRVAIELYEGTALRVWRDLGWNRTTVSKAITETRADSFREGRTASGRPPAERRLPNLMEDLKSVCDSLAQTDPTFRSTRLYLRASVPAVRQLLIDLKGYTDEQLPGENALRRKLGTLDIHLRRVRKSKPKKRSHKPTPSSSRSRAFDSER
jgi:hypothetical protein